MPVFPSINQGCLFIARCQATHRSHLPSLCVPFRIPCATFLSFPSYFPFLPRVTKAVATQNSHLEPPSLVTTETLLGNGCNVETILSGTKKEEKKTEKGRGWEWVRG